ncbi:hypothetical protein G6F57_023346 [Rhizopus arrhizus]|nr:hypothetical protein G6F57_023346 [Rhizopus arrhizus]
MHAGLHRDREQQRPEQHDGGNAFQDAAQDDEGDDGHGQETVAAAGHAGHQAGQPTISMMAPDSEAVSISMGRTRAQSKRR